MPGERTEFSITNSNTCWVFISDSTEVRHIFDVVHAVYVLKQRGVADSAIKFFTDDPMGALYTVGYGVPIPRPIASLQGELQATTGFENLFIVVAGHGGVEGIGHPVKISPADLVRFARSTPEIRLVTIALTQCFAGVFNFINARAEPPIVMFGAANLDSSISTLIDLGTPIPSPLFTGGLQRWHANVFMLYLFKWISSPRDIDGDGRVCLLDAYKYSGASASSEIVFVKPSIFLESLELASTLKRQEEDLASGNVTNPLTAQLEITATRQELDVRISILHTSQEPWLLYADLARNITFS